ncbi:MAG: toll/interleukin-1 receptor domain-containing protein [Ruminococcaceae bacterium]|nr:toll/interleukin-1 receptor domain-containing protein [Oscillospiraceae bacterium]
MKRVVCIALILILASANLTAYGFVYPTYEGVNKNEVTYTERINIVFDNSGHEYVETMFQNVLMASAVSENTKIWIYPVAGQQEPILVEPSGAFSDKYYNLYSKSSNEFKAENIYEKALNDLKNDTSVSKKRLILMPGENVAQIRSEFNYVYLENYMASNPDILFSMFYNGSYMLNVPSYRKYSNYECVDDKDFHEFMLLQNGYSLCEAIFNEQESVVKIEKGSAGNNIAIFAKGYKTRRANVDGTRKDVDLDLFISGCLLNTEGYETYKAKSKVKGVSLSYNNFSMKYDSNYNASYALFTLDGTTINPLEDDLYIPVINANSVTVYYRNQKGAGVCSENTVYKNDVDKKIFNINAPQEDAVSKEESSGTGLLTKPFSSTAQSEETGVKKVLSIVLGILGTVLGLIIRLIKLAIFVFIILLIFVPKVRSYVQLKILSSKFAPYYEKLVIKVKKIISDIVGAGVKIKGATDMQGDYVFISKASADMGLPNNRVALVVKELEKRGIKCWLSETGIKAGDNYNAVLPLAIRSCKMFLLFISPMSVKSSDVVSEIGTAKEYKKPIVPVQIEQFDLFKMYSDWAYMLKQYQKTDLFSSKEEDVKAICDQIVEAYNKI